MLEIANRTAGTVSLLTNALLIGLGVFTPLGPAIGLGDCVASGCSTGQLGMAIMPGGRANKFHHIFGKATHNLDDFVRAMGSQEKAFDAVEEAVRAAHKAGELTVSRRGRYSHRVRVGGFDLTVTGGNRQRRTCGWNLLAMTNNSRVLNAFERAVLEKLLFGNHPVLTALRAQLGACQVVSREFTGHGFFTNLEVDRAVSPAPAVGPRVAVRDVGAEITGLSHGAGFVLFVIDGYLSVLEGFSYEGPWPDVIAEFTLHFEGVRDQDPSAIEF